MHVADVRGRGAFQLESMTRLGGTDRYRRIVVGDSDNLGRVAALIVARQLSDNPRSVLALPTGRTPLALYRWLVRLHQEGAVDFAATRCFNLDEFYGIPAEHPGSFASNLRHELFDLVNFRPENINLLDPMPQDADEECRINEEKVRDAGGLDLAILGIGQNGHIGFNEPGSAFDSRTRLVKLKDQTIADNSLPFGEASQVPRLALTMGIGTIMEAREILLLAAGRAKAPILARALEGEIGTDVPASVLRHHPRLAVIADEAAARGC